MTEERRKWLANMAGSIIIVVMLALLMRSCKMHYRAPDNSVEFKWNLNQNESLIDEEKRG